MIEAVTTQLPTLLGVLVLVLDLFLLTKIFNLHRRLVENQTKLKLLLANEHGRQSDKKILSEKKRILKKGMSASSQVTENIHKSISNLTFNILDSIPATKNTAKKVREVHDSTADGVYRTINLINQQLADAPKTELKNEIKKTDI